MWYLFPELKKKKKLYSKVTDVTESFVIMQYNKIKNDKARVIIADTGRTNKCIIVLHRFHFIIVPPTIRMCVKRRMLHFQKQLLSSWMAPFASKLAKPGEMSSIQRNITKD